MVRTGLASTPGWVVAIAVLALAQSACRKPEEDLGLDLLPGDPLGLVVDSAELRAYTFSDSAVQTSGLTRNLVGSYLDPEFGLLRTGIVAQVRLTTNNVGQGQDTSGLQADSIVLSLAYELPLTHYGNLNPQLFRVHELTEDLSIDTVYRSDDVPLTGAEDLVYPHAGSITPRPLEQPVIGGESQVPQLRIRLRDELAERFLDAFGTPALVDNAAFLAFFKGLYITVDNGIQAPYQGGVLYINTLSTASRLTVHYKDVNSSEPELARTFVMAMNSNGVRYTVAQRDRTQALDPALVNALSDTTAPAPTIYLQTLGGLRSALRFPDLLDVVGRTRALAKAELVVPVKGTYYPYYAPPSQVFLFRKGTDGDDVFLPDQLNGISGIGGQFDASAQEYRFNITRYVQGVVNGDVPDNGIELVSGSTGVSANRAILCGPDDPQEAMRLVLTFTTY